MLVARLFVDLVDDEYHTVTSLERFFEYELRLRHRTFFGIYEQQTTVNQIHNALHLSTKICMAWRIHDVELLAFPLDRRVLGKNRNATLTLKLVTIHDGRSHGLPFSKRMRLFQKRIDQGGLPMVDVRDNGDVT